VAVSVGNGGETRPIVLEFEDERAGDDCCLPRRSVVCPVVGGISTVCRLCTAVAEASVIVKICLHTVQVVCLPTKSSLIFHRFPQLGHTVSSFTMVKAAFLFVLLISVLIIFPFPISL